MAIDRREIGPKMSHKSGLARPERFELPTPRSVVWCSIQLSYGRFGRSSQRPKFRRRTLHNAGSDSKDGRWRLILSQRAFDTGAMPLLGRNVLSRMPENTAVAVGEAAFLMGRVDAIG